MVQNDKRKESIKKLKSITDDFDFISDVNKPIKLGCNSCGKCCRNRNDILLKPNDIYCISKFLNKPFNDIYKYFDIYIGENSLVPVISIKFREEENGDTICPFLKKVNNNIYHCRIHEAKPSVCRMYPLGRIKEEDKIKYLLQNIECVQEEEKITTTINEWTKKEENFGEEFLTKFFVGVDKLNKKINLKKLWKRANEKNETKFIISIVFTALYGSDKDISLKENLDNYEKRFDKILNELITYLKKNGYGVVK